MPLRLYHLFGLSDLGTFPGVRFTQRYLSFASDPAIVGRPCAVPGRRRQIRERTVAVGPLQHRSLRRDHALVTQRPLARMVHLLLVAAAAVLLSLGVTSPMASATPTALTPAGSALLARAVSYDPHSGEVFQADPTTSSLRVYRPDGHGGYTQIQSVPVGAGPVSTVFDAATGHVLTADQRAGTVTTLARGGDGSWGSLGSTPVGFAPAVVVVERGSGVVHAAGVPGAHRSRADRHADPAHVHRDGPGRRPPVPGRGRCRIRRRGRCRRGGRRRRGRGTR